MVRQVLNSYNGLITTVIGALAVAGIVGGVVLHSDVRSIETTLENTAGDHDQVIILGQTAADIEEHLDKHEAALDQHIKENAISHEELKEQNHQTDKRIQQIENDIKLILKAVE